jgi:hypothetical protein
MNLGLNHQDLETILELIEGRFSELYSEVRRSKGLTHEELKNEKQLLQTLRGKISELLGSSTKHETEFNNPSIYEKDSDYKNFFDL